MKTKIVAVVLSVTVLFAGFHGITKPQSANAAADLTAPAAVIVSYMDDTNELR